MSFCIKLIAGLGNPGSQYTNTRHNAGYWFINKIAAYYQLTLHLNKKFQGYYSNFIINNSRIHLLNPVTFMNHSGQAVKAIADFYSLSPESILIAHDELDIPAGDIRLKYAGGHGGHNGLRDIISQLQNPHFYRLRIGIDHPHDKRLVTDYVLSSPSAADKNLIHANLERLINPNSEILGHLFNGAPDKAMQILNTRS